MSTDGSSFGGLGMSALDLQAKMAAQQVHELEPRAGDNSVEAAQKFESYLAQVMLREMRKTVPEGGIFSSPPMDTFSSLISSM